MIRARVGRGFVIVGAALALAGLLAEGARAQDELLQELKTITSVRIEGNRQVSTGAIRSVMKTRGPSIWPWAERPTLRLDFLRTDVAAITALYRHHGLLDAKVDYRVGSSRDPEEVSVEFLIREGDRTEIATVELVGVAHYPDRDLRKKLFARPGRPFDPAFLQLDTLLISELYQDRGYRPHVAASARRLTPDSLQAVVRYEVHEGPEYRVGEVLITRRDRVNEKLVRRELVLRRGDVYRRSQVLRSLERLYQTGLFSQAQITPLVDSTNTRVDFALAVRERKSRWTDLGVGSGTNERFRLIAEWGHRNLLGLGQQAAVRSRLTFYTPAQKVRFQRWHIEASLLEPWLFRSRTRGQVTPYYELRDDWAGDTVRVGQEFRGIDFQLRREFSRTLSATLTQKNVWVDQALALKILDPAVRDSIELSVVPSYSTHRLEGGFERDMRNHLLVPTRGSIQSITAEVAGGPLRGSSSFRKTHFVSSWYTPLRNDWNLATRIRAGFMEPVGDREERFSPDPLTDAEVARVPVEDRFRSGGVNSIRGFGENEVGPDLGGLAVLQGNVELRIPTPWRVPFLGPLGVEVYMDAGNVWARPRYIKARQFIPHFSRSLLGAHDVRYVVGLGPRVDLPIGPLRLDFTWSLRPETEAEAASYGEPVIQVAIGPSF
jgi:outer membrane protein insertion porin family